MRRTCAVLLLLLALVAGGCGDKKADSASTLQLLPDVTTSDQWARRIVVRFLTPLNRDLQVLNGLNSPDIRIFIASGNQTTIGVINRRMNDLKRCTDKLIVIGPPTSDDEQFQRVDRLFHQACANYEKVAGEVLEAVPMLSSGRSDVIKAGAKRLQKSIPASETAAKDFKQAIKIAQTRPEFRNAGLQSST